MAFTIPQTFIPLGLILAGAKVRSLVEKIVRIRLRHRTTGSDLVFLGTGVSTGLPSIGHAVRGKGNGERCIVCENGLRDPLHPDHRCNVSVLLRLQQQDGTKLNILIDCGKTIRDAALRWFPVHGVKGVDAVLLTHGHADAMMGLDDLRDLQVTRAVLDEKGDVLDFEAAEAMPVFLSAATMDVCASAFSYLVPKKPPPPPPPPVDSTTPGAPVNGGMQCLPGCECCPVPVVPEPPKTARRVAKIEWNVIEESCWFDVRPGVAMRTLPMYHGGTYICTSFLIKAQAHHEPAGPQPSTQGEPAGPFKLAYLSDVKDVPSESMPVLESAHIELLVVDALFRTKHNTHFNLDEALALIRRLRPTRALLVGMSCQMGSHYDTNRELAALKRTENLDVQLARDGQRVSLNM